MFELNPFSEARAGGNSTNGRMGAGQRLAIPCPIMSVSIFLLLDTQTFIMQLSISPGCLSSSGRAFLKHHYRYAICVFDGKFVEGVLSTTESSRCPQKSEEEIKNYFTVLFIELIYYISKTCQTPLKHIRLELINYCVG